MRGVVNMTPLFSNETTKNRNHKHVFPRTMVNLLLRCWRMCRQISFCIDYHRSCEHGSSQSEKALPGNIFVWLTHCSLSRWNIWDKKLYSRKIQINTHHKLWDAKRQVLMTSNHVSDISWMREDVILATSSLIGWDLFHIIWSNT